MAFSQRAAGSARTTIDPGLDDGLLLGQLKIFEDRREERLDERPHRRILPAGRAASLDQVVDLFAVALRKIAVAQQALQPSPQRQSEF